jgi:hypothetical protein
MTQHSSIAPERWALFTVGQQILQIGAEMQRGLKFLAPGRLAYLRGCYERAVELVDLTVQVNENAGLRRELNLWRGVVLDLSARDEPDVETHRAALKALFQLDPEAALQIPLLGL